MNVLVERAYLCDREQWSFGVVDPLLSDMEIAQECIHDNHYPNDIHITIMF